MENNYINVINYLVKENNRLLRKIDKLENELYVLKTGYDLKISNISLDDIYILMLKLYQRGEKWKKFMLLKKMVNS